MPELNRSAAGIIIGPTKDNQVDAHDAGAGTHTDTGDTPLTTEVASAVQWFRCSGRGGGTFRYIRTFLYFDTSAITATVSSATLKVYPASTFNNADVIAVKSTAFGGDGGTALADGDFDANDYSTSYSIELSTWSTSAFNDITLNATARADMQNNDSFIVAIIEHDSDYLDQDTSDGAFTVGINFKSSLGPKIDFTEVSGYGNDVIGVASANIAAVKGVATANISEVIGV